MTTEVPGYAGSHRPSCGGLAVSRFINAMSWKAGGRPRMKLDPIRAPFGRVSRRPNESSSSLGSCQLVPRRELGQKKLGHFGLASASWESFPSSALSALEWNGLPSCVIAREEAATESTCHSGLAPLSFARWRWYDDGPTHVTAQGLEPTGFLGPLLPRRGRHTRRVVR